MSAAGLSEPITGPVGLRVTLLFARPKQVKAGHVLHGRAGRVHLSGGGSFPDLSNVVKAIEDGLQGVVYADDHQVCILEASKLYCGPLDEAGAYVEVWSVASPFEGGQ